MTHQEIRKKFLDFFEKRGHKVVPSSSLIPDDPSVLFTTAGMQQFKPYFLGTADPMRDFGTQRAASIQKSMRTSDIDEVGDESHLTFFEMLGHFSFGDYFKKETIKWTYLLLTDIFKISPDRISATVFAGDEKIPFDNESYYAWMQFLPQERVKKGSRQDNVWGPAGPEGPCGAANEVYVDGLEIATLVFMEYYCDRNGNLTPLVKKGVDVGWGFERIIKIIQDKDNIFETDLFKPIVNKIESEVKNPLDTERSYRIIADHLRASVFLISDGLRPSNKDQGYILRRLIRRATMHARLRDNYNYPFMEIFNAITNVYKNNYPELDTYRQEIETVLYEEVKRFSSRIKEGEEQYLKFGKKISGKEAFLLQQSYGFPIELIRELAKRDGKEIDQVRFEEETLKHQEKSRAGAEKKFGLK